MYIILGLLIGFVVCAVVYIATHTTRVGVGPEDIQKRMDAKRLQLQSKTK